MGDSPPGDRRPDPFRLSCGPCACCNPPAPSKKVRALRGFSHDCPTEMEDSIPRVMVYKLACVRFGSERGHGLHATAD